MIVLVRRIVVIPTLVLALPASGVVVALAASGGESSPISKTRAVAYVHAVNLRRGDFAGLAQTGDTIARRRGSRLGARRL
jgi:hypothetical protein